MSDPERSFTAALALGLRTPLSRIELAASRLEREAVTPAARGLAEGICDAVEELDRMIVQLTAVLAPPPPIDPPRAPLAEVLPAMRDRLAPVLAARGVQWLEPELDAGAVGDPDALKLTALSLIRAGTELAGGGGRVSIQLQTEAGRSGVRLEVASDAPVAIADSALRELRSRVLIQGGSVELTPRSDGCVASVWFASAGAPCSGS